MRVFLLVLISFVPALNSFFADTGFLATKFPEIINPCSPDNTSFIYIDLVNERRRSRKNPFNTDVPGDLPDSKGFVDTFAGSLKNHTLEVLDPFLVSFLDLIMNGDGITSLECREFPFLNKCIFYEFYSLSTVHDFQ